MFRGTQMTNSAQTMTTEQPSLREQELADKLTQAEQRLLELRESFRQIVCSYQYSEDGGSIRQAMEEMYIVASDEYQALSRELRDKLDYPPRYTNQPHRESVTKRHILTTLTNGTASEIVRLSKEIKKYGIVSDQDMPEYPVAEVIGAHAMKWTETQTIGVNIVLPKGTMLYTKYPIGYRSETNSHR